MRKINRLLTKSNQFWRWFGNINVHAIPLTRSLENATNRNFEKSSKFLGICDIEIRQVTMNICEAQAVCVSCDVVKYGNRW